VFHVEHPVEVWPCPLELPRSRCRSRCQTPRYAVPEAAGLPAQGAKRLVTASRSAPSTRGPHSRCHSRCRTPRYAVPGPPGCQIPVEVPVRDAPLEVPNTSLRRCQTSRYWCQTPRYSSLLPRERHRSRAGRAQSLLDLRQDELPSLTRTRDFCSAGGLIVLRRTRPWYFIASRGRGVRSSGDAAMPQSRASRKTIARALCRDLQRPSEGAAGPAVGDLGKTTCQRLP